MWNNLGNFVVLCSAVGILVFLTKQYLAAKELAEGVRKIVKALEPDHGSSLFDIVDRQGQELADLKNDQQRENATLAKHGETLDRLEKNHAERDATQKKILAELVQVKSDLASNAEEVNKKIADAVISGIDGTVKQAVLDGMQKK